MSDAGKQSGRPVAGSGSTRGFPRLFSAAFLAVSCVVAATAGRTAAQNPPAPRDGTTYVNEQFAAYEELARVRGLVDRREWDRAAEACDALLDRFGDSLIRAPSLATSRPHEAEFESFVGLPAVVIGEITSGPAELLAAYRRRYESAARQTLTRPATQPSAPRRAALRYFATSAAAVVIEQAGDRFVESGDFLAARRFYDLLATQHPDRAARGRAWEAKRALCSAWLGDRAEADRIVAAPEATPPVPIEWAGRRGTPREFLRSAVGALTTQPAGDEGSLPSPGSAASPLAGAVSPTSITAEARLWQFVDHAARAAGLDRAADEPGGEPDDAQKRALLTGQHLGAMPLAYEGLLYFSDRRRVWAVDPRAPDRPRWHYELDPETEEPAERGWAAQDEPPALHTLSAAHGRVYAHLDRTETDSSDPPRPGASTLVCLDARDGGVVWRRDVDALGGPFDECRLDGAPLVLDDALVAVVRRRKPFGFEACLLAGFDARGGTLLWRTHLGEAATGGYGYHRPTRTFPAASGHRVFVHSNIGTIAAVDADDGRVEWLRRYASAFGRQGADAWAGRSTADFHPWQYQPTLVWRENVIVAPLDTDRIYVLNQRDGSVVRRIGMDVLRAPETLLGVLGDRLYAIGGWVVCYDLSKNGVAWERQLPAGRLFGRGAMAGDAIFVPTDAALFRYPIDGGPPASYAWNSAAAGNVLPMTDQVVVACGRSLVGLVEKLAAFERLERRMASDPADAAPALALAELAFETGEDARGLSAVDEAVRRARGAGRLLDGSLKSRIFRTCMDHADRLYAAAQAQPESAKPRLESALRLLDRAAACAPDADAEVRYRLKRADVQAAGGGFAAAVTTYQQILSDPGLAQRPMETDARGAVGAGPWVRQRIARLVAEQGRDVYAEVERAAADRLRGAASDPAALRTVAERYPNSKAASRALIRRAGLLRKTGESAEAARDLHRALALGDAADAPTILHDLAELLVQAGRTAAARATLARGARKYPATRFTHDGRSIGFVEMSRLLLGDAESAASGSRLRFPLSRRYLHEFPAPPTLLIPGRTPDRPSREFLTFGEERLESFDGPTGRTLWPQALKCPAKPTLLSIDGRTALLATPLQFFAVDLDRGARLWTVGSSAAEADKPGVDPERIAHFTVQSLASDRLYAANDHGELLAIDTASGRIAWRIATQPRIGTRLIAEGRRLAYAGWENRQNIVVLLDAATGRVLHRIPLAAERPLQRFAYTDDGTLLAITTTTLHAIDADAGRVLWTAPLDGPALVTSMVLGPEGLYLSTDAAKLSRHDLLTGTLRWSTPPLAQAGNELFYSFMQDDRIYVATQGGLSAVDAASGAVEWESAGLRVTEFLSAGPDNDDLLIVAEAASDAPLPDAPAPIEPRAAGTRFVVQRLDPATGTPRRVASAASRPAASESLDLDGADAILPCGEALIVLSGHVISGYSGVDPARAASRPADRAARGGE